MLRIPGFVDIGTEIPDGSWQLISQQAIRNGYTYLIAFPSPGEIYAEKADLIRAMTEPDHTAMCDYAKLAMITPENTRCLDEWVSEVPAAFLDFSEFESRGTFAQMTMLSRLFNRWPAEKPICIRGNENQIGSAIFMAQVNRRKLHVCSVATRTEIEMIDEAKNSGVSVSCDIHPLSLLLSDETPGASGKLKRLGTEDDRQALWQYLRIIDCFSSAGYISSSGEKGGALNVMIPLLFSMRSSEMLTDEDILKRCCVNPARLFGIHFDTATAVEIDEKELFTNSSAHNFVVRVQMHGQTVYSADPSDAVQPVRASRIRGFNA